MIILNHYKETNIILQYALYKKPLSPIVGNKKMKGTALFLKTVLQSMQQPCLCVIHSGCQIGLVILSDVNVVKISNLHPEFLFFQYVKAFKNFELNRRIKSVFLYSQAWHFDSQNAVCKGALAPLNPLDDN
jgi:hypothetical protein